MDAEWGGSMRYDSIKKFPWNMTLGAIQDDELIKNLNNVQGVSSVFLGPDFITITKSDSIDWELITQDIINIFDKL